MAWNISDRISQRTQNLKASGIRRIRGQALAMEKEGRKVIHLELGRPDFDTPDYIKKSCEDSLEHGDVFYTSNAGDDGLRKAVAEYLANRTGAGFLPGEVIITSGVSEALFCTFASLLDAGDEILVPDPAWVNYNSLPAFFGALPISYSLQEERKFQPDPGEIERKINGRTKALVLISPNNPTGSVLSFAILRSLARLACQHDLIVISDEIYERLVFDGNEHHSIVSFPGMKERTVLLGGFSKTYSMTGWRLGYAAAPEEVISEMNKVHQQNTNCAVSFVQKAGIRALTGESGEVEAMLSVYQKKRDFAVASINRIPKIHCLSPAGAFYIFINIRGLGLPSEEMAQILLNNYGVAMVPGSFFGPGGEGYLRMSFAASGEEIMEGIRLLNLAVRNIVMLTEDEKIPQCRKESLSGKESFCRQRLSVKEKEDI